MNITEAQVKTVSRVVFDVEANGLLEEATEVWCISTINPDTGDRHDFVHPLSVHTVQCSGDIDTGLAYLSQFDEIICHNVIGYDLPLFEKLKGWVPGENQKVTDTLLLSKLTHFDRRFVLGCKSGPHSVEAWGMRFGRAKPEHEDWSKFSPDMLHRCKEDTEIQLMVWCAVYQEMSEAGSWEFAIWLEHEFAKIKQKQNLRGWKFDIGKAQALLGYVNDRMEEQYQRVLPHLPIVVKDEKSLLNPITKKGVWAKHTKKWVDSIFPGHNCQQNGPDGIMDVDNYGKPYNWSIGGDPELWTGKDVHNGAFCRVSFAPLNIASDTQLKPWLLSIGWRPIEWNISKKTRKPSSPKLTEESYASLSSGIGPDIAAWLKGKHRRGMIEGWLKLVRIDGTLPAPSQSIGTPTGRQSHRVIVNVPGEDAWLGMELRALFVATPGYKIVGCDSKSCQARLLCHRMGDEGFTDAVVNGNKEDGTDLHSYNMKLLGVVRRQAKAFFYAFSFGAQAAKIGSIIGKGKKGGQAMIDTYYAKLPQLKEVIDTMRSFWDEYGYVIGMDGRAVRVRKAHEILCYDLQMGESISVKLAAVLADQWAKAENLEYHLLICMHDELQYDVLPEHVERFSQLLESAFSTAGEMMHLTVPLGGDVSVGDNWADTH